MNQGNQNQEDGAQAQKNLQEKENREGNGLEENTVEESTEKDETSNENNNKNEQHKPGNEEAEKTNNKEEKAIEKPKEGPKVGSNTHEAQNPQEQQKEPKEEKKTDDTAKTQPEIKIDKNPPKINKSPLPESIIVNRPLENFENQPLGSTNLNTINESSEINNKSLQQQDTLTTGMVETLNVNFDSFIPAQQASQVSDQNSSSANNTTTKDISNMLRSARFAKSTSLTNPEASQKKYQKNGLFKASLIYPDGTRYSGYIGPKMRREGFGSIKWPNGATYTGQFKNDFCHGKGCFRHNEIVYNGHFIEDVPDGYGDLQVGEYIYEGSFFDGEKFDQGYEIMPDGSRFKGVFDCGRRCGMGTLFDSLGKIVEKKEFDEEAGNSTQVNIPQIQAPSLKEYRANHMTDFFNIQKSAKNPKNEKLEGDARDGFASSELTQQQPNLVESQGTMRNSSAFRNQLDSKYIGEVNLKNQKQGHGIKVFGEDSPFSKYEGEWEDGKFHGTGKLIFKNGDIYEGEFQEGKFHGKGNYLSKDLSRYEGDWIYGNKTGFGALSTPDGSVLRGQFINDDASGFVKIEYEDGGLYWGLYVDKQIHGRGRMIYGSGDIYEGEFSFEKKDGFGVYRWADGTIHAGYWKNDSPHNFGIVISKENSASFHMFKDGRRLKNMKNHQFLNPEIEASFCSRVPNIILRGQESRARAQSDPLSALQPQTREEGSTPEEVNYTGEYLKIEKLKQSPNARLVFSNNSCYVGEFRMDRFEGIGNFEYDSGLYLEGEWVMDQLHGEFESQVVYENKDKYEGGFFFGLKHGPFEESFDGVTVTGEYLYGLRSGKGKLKIQGRDENEAITGSFVNNKIEGPVLFLAEKTNQLYSIGGCSVYSQAGAPSELQSREIEVKDIEEILIAPIKHNAAKIFQRMCFKPDSLNSEINYQNGAVYKGQLLMGMRHGSGTFTWPDGSVYTGDWQYGSATGYGNLSLASGVKYKGGWAHSEISGFGVFFDKEGKRYEGVWDGDYLEQLIKFGWDGGEMVNQFDGDSVEIHFENGDVYRGSYVDGAGEGVYIWAGSDRVRSVVMKDGAFRLATAAG